MIDNPSTLKVPGQVVIDSVLLYVHGEPNPVSIADNVMEINIYEDLFSFSMYADLTIADTLSIRTHYPINGGEKVVIKWKTPGRDRLVVFNGYIDSLLHLKQSNRTEAYTIRLMSAVRYDNSFSFLSGEYSGVVKDIISSIWNQNFSNAPGNKLLVPNCDTKVKFVSNGWSPIEIFNFLSHVSINQNGVPDYVIYETPFGINFKSIEDLYKVPTQQEYFFYEGKMKELDDRFKTTLTTMNQEEKFSITEFIKRGLFGSTTIAPNIYTKSYKNHFHYYTNNFFKTQHLNKYPVLRNTPDMDGRVLSANTGAKLLIIPESKYQIDGYENNQLSKLADKRIASLSGLIYNSGVVTIHGDSERHVGDVVKFAPNLSDVTQTKKSTDPFLSGRWLVTSCRHVFGKDDYSCVMELSTDSYITPIPDTNKINF